MLSDLILTDQEFLPPLRIERLARLNLFVGKNGVGKTAVLEAIHDRPKLQSIWVDRHREPFCSSCEPVLKSHKGGVVLIDGAGHNWHHTRMADLWRYWCKRAEDFDLQIFASTHSWDCIKGFAAALQENDKVDGMVIRLENDGYWAARGEMGACCIDEDKLPIIIREHIEIR